MDLDPKAVVQLVITSGRKQTDIFPSNANGHVLTFKTETQAKAHMDIGKYVRKLEGKSVFDDVRIEEMG